MTGRIPYYTYIVTDSNRKFLTPAIGQHLDTQAPTDSIGTLPCTDSKRRIVLIETHGSQQDAENRLLELYKMTRLVRERLIRKNNPNWLAIRVSLRPNLPSIKKAVAFA